MSYILSDNTLRKGISHCNNTQKHKWTQIIGLGRIRQSNCTRKTKKNYICAVMPGQFEWQQRQKDVCHVHVWVFRLSTQLKLYWDSSWWCKTDGPFYATSASELNIIKATHTDLTSLQYFLLWWASASQKDSRKQYKELWIWHFKSQTFAFSKMPLKTKAIDTNRFSWIHFLGATLYNILAF